MQFKVQWLDSAPSTNTRLRTWCEREPHLADGTLIAAREQTQGRGRYDRRWASAPGLDLCFSALVREPAPPSQTASLSMAAALAVDEMLCAQRMASRPKWPNDVLVGEAKICGILTERIDHGRDALLILGIGLNVNADAERLSALDRPATSMRIENDETYVIDHVLEALLPRLGEWIDRWRGGYFPVLRARWIERTAWIGRQTVIRERDRRWSGVLESFGACGQALLRLDNGQRQEIWAGEME